MKELSFEGMRVVVLGDIMLDRYFYGHVNRISPEAPVPILDFSYSEVKLGGAANVALNLKALETEVMLVSVTGDDNYGSQLRDLVQKEGFQTDYLLKDIERRTTVKTRVVDGTQQLLRVDEEDTFDISSTLLQQFIDRITLLVKEWKPDVLILQDYNKGLLTKKMIKDVIEIAKSNDIFVAVDPKEKNFFEYKNVDLFKPNLKEMEEAIKTEIVPDIETLKKASNILHDKIDNKYALISLSEHGVFITNSKEAFVVPTSVKDVVDVCGAGDAVLSISALALSRGFSLLNTAVLSNMAGGNVCENTGVCPINIEKLKTEYLNL